MESIVDIPGFGEVPVGVLIAVVVLVALLVVAVVLLALVLVRLPRRGVPGQPGPDGLYAADQMRQAVGGLVSQNQATTQWLADSLSAISGGLSTQGASTAETVRQVQERLVQLAAQLEPQAASTATDVRGVQEQLRSLAASLTPSAEATRVSVTELQRGLADLRAFVGAQGTQTSDTLASVRRSVEDMGAIMLNHKTRGTWGEYQLDVLLGDYAGASRDVYETQYHLANGTIVDAALHLPGTDCVLAIDSKFPLENYVAMQQPGLDEAARKAAHQRFVADVKERIREVADKYVNAETDDHALMFVPSEAVFAQICADDADLFDVALRRHVAIVSPTTLMGTVTTIVALTNDFNRSQNVREVVELIVGLQENALRLAERMEDVERSFNALDRKVHDVGVSARKVARDIDRIGSGYLDDNVDEEIG
ncbi:MAG: DNA recombination protein RmuC [Coriobacteriia bacterium]|nr:DNA recombination protein RmuC [Coriobacteriia bacterium]